MLDRICTVDHLYNKVRNYITQKPYSTDKIKLNFQNLQLLGGWDNNKISDYKSALLRKGNDYFLAVIDKSCGKALSDYPHPNDSEDVYELMNYKFLPNPHQELPKVFFAKSNLDEFQPSQRILDIRNSGTFKKGIGFNKDDCTDLIDFYQKSIKSHKDWSQFGFKFKKPEEYDDISVFYRDISDQGYKISFDQIPAAYIDSLVEAGKLYLFMIYNKDFSTKSKRGEENRTPNLHTLYFKMLFDTHNLEDVVYKLNGQAEMFYRKPSINKSDAVVHLANIGIKNKNPNNPKSESVFDYEIIKDRRYTRPQFMLHLPITMNYKSNGNGLINERVRQAIKDGKCKHIIGIDRGERNLLYVSVIDDSGKVIHQESLNVIVNKDIDYDVNYHALLSMREVERKKARQSWSSIESIKSLKEGYLSQAVKRVTDLVIKYDAIIVMEDLNSGFKNSRVKFEKQVYQKFENKLIDKLNYLVDKKTDISKYGGLMHAYQLTQRVENSDKENSSNNKNRFNKKPLQNGIIFYVPAWLTSKIDPVTGFVDLLKPKYKSVEDAKSFISSFISISYDSGLDMFKFDFDYRSFPKGDISFIPVWSIYTNGSRVLTYRNPDKNNEWDSKDVQLTDSFKSLFDKYDVDYSGQNNLIPSILDLPSQFYKDFIRLLSLVLQMRNSVSGSVADDHIVSPVMMKNGGFYESDNCDEHLPNCADANGAYNIARKGLWVVEQIEESDIDNIMKVKVSISNKEWLKMAQSNNE